MWSSIVGGAKDLSLAYLCILILCMCFEKVAELPGMVFELLG